MSQEEAFEKLEQLVFDENRVVTYKGLSRVLNIHANKAKQFLYEFLSTYSKGHEKLSAHYFVAGLQTKDNSQFVRVIVVPAEELENTKKEFVSLTSLHIYCVQNGQLVDKCALYSTDYGQTEQVEDQNRYSAIKYPQVKIQQARILKNDSSTAAKEKSKADSVEIKAEPKIKEKTSSKSKSPALFSMWQKMSTEKKPAEEAKNSNDTQIVDSKKAKSADNNKKVSRGNTQECSSKNESKGDRNNVKHLFSKQVEKNLSQPKEKKIDEKKPATQDVKEDSNHQKIDGMSSKEVEKKQLKQRMKTKKSKKISDSDSDEDFKHKKKKHKRIITMVDSDSESECEEEKDKTRRILYDSESPIPDKNVLEEEDEEPIPPTPPVSGGKRKKWKNVTKTFEDADGFFVTKQSKEYVTASEESESEELKAKIPSKKEPVSKKTFLNKKQASLTSFFKQK